MRDESLKMDNNYILVLNAGSATLKWSLFEYDDLVEFGRGVVERIGSKGSFTEWRLKGKTAVKYSSFKDHKSALTYVLKMLAWHGFDLNRIKIVAHRIVHGGSKFQAPTKLNSSVLKQISQYNNLAPLHNPIQLMVANLAIKLLPQAKPMAVFDTAWFTNLPPQACEYALPQQLVSKYNLRRFGFHGISHSYVAGQAARGLNKSLDNLNLITCHLGSGSSITAVRGGRAIDTSMGFTPLEGLMMCTRAGDIDPGILLHLLSQKGMNVKKLQIILQNESGLKGVAGVSDMREVMVRAGYEVLGFKEGGKISAEDKKRAGLAFKMFLYRVQKYIGAYVAILGRVDAVVFTGGIGERNEAVRNLIMKGLPNFKDIPILVIPTNEELAIAQQVLIK
jgi:acetate kinase